MMQAIVTPNAMENGCATLGRTVLSGLLGMLFCGIISTVPALSKSKSVFGAWTVDCGVVSKKEVCAASQKHFLADSGQLAFSLEYTKAKIKSGKLTGFLVARAPLETYLLSGVTLRVGRKRNVRLPFEFCAVSGCVASIKVSNQLLRALKKASKAQVSFYTLNGKSIKIPVSLIGFTAALKTMGS